MSDTLIAGLARTPIGRFQGALAGVAATRLGATALAACLGRTALPATRVKEVVLGNVLGAGLGQAPARQAALAAGLPASVAAQSIDKVCGSGLQALISGARAVALAEADFVLAGGQESMSQAPFLLKDARGGLPTGDRPLLDSLLLDGLYDASLGCHMGVLAERCARDYGLTRDQQDDFAAASFQRAQQAARTGCFAAELVPVATPARRGVAGLVTEDEGPARFAAERLASLPPAFEPDGSITAANASQLSDGAAALLLGHPAAVTAAGLRPLARLVSWGSHAGDPAQFSVAPVAAIREALASAGWRSDSVDLWEINEAFAVVPLVAMRELSLTHAKVNVWGGAIALGHPLGASGARIVVTLVAALQRLDLRRGVAAICIGGGEALALCVERCD